MDNQAFLYDLFGDIEDPNRILVWRMRKKDGEFFKESDWFPSAHDATLFANSPVCQDCDVYFGLGIAPRSYGPHNRCPANEVVGIPGYWLDVDIKGDNHADQNLPETEEAAMALLAEFPLPPSFVVRSGGGMHAYWKFVEPWMFDTIAERRRAGEATKAFVDTFRAAARQHGFKVDAVHDLARILRVPGTLNHKTDPPRKVELIVASGKEYQPSEFEDFFISLADSGQSLFDEPIVYQVGNIRLDPQALAPHLKHSAAMENEEKYKLTWDKHRRDLTDQSASSYDMSIANLAVSYGWTDQEIVDTLINRRRQYRDELKLDRLDYYTTTIRKARQGRRIAVAQDNLDMLPSTRGSLEVTSQSSPLAPEVIAATIESVQNNPEQINSILDDYSCPERMEILDAIMGLDGRKKINREPRLAAKRLIDAENSRVASEFTDDSDDQLPIIDTSNVRLLLQTDRAVEALMKKNDPPTIFVQSGRIVRIKPTDTGGIIIEPLDVNSLTHELARAANFFRRNAKKAYHITPPKDVVNDILSSRSLPFPILIGFTECPVLRKDGTIVISPGYDAQTKLYYHPDPELNMPCIPDEPTENEVKEALRLVSEMIQDFNFVDPESLNSKDKCITTSIETSSRANYLAFMLTPLMRPVIDSATPMALIDSPNAGTGKGKLKDCASIIATGKISAPMPMPTTEEEMGKVLLASLRGGNPFMGFDNVDSIIKSGALCSVLTAYPEWESRLLGHSDIIRVINNATWSATGNNLRMSGDMARRTYRIRIDSLTSTPWARTDFLHANLNQWVRKNRGKLLAAFFTFIRAWYVAKCPSPKGTPLGSFVEWFNHVGGVLEFVGVPNFLSNQQASMERYDQHGTEWSRFLLELVRMNVNANVGDNLFTSKDLAGYITADYGTLDEVLPAELADILAYPHSKALTQRVGNILVAEEETRFGPYNLYIKRMGKKHGAAAWCVKSDDPGWLDKALAED